MRSAVRLEAGSRSLYDSCRNQVSRVCVIYSVIPLRFDLATSTRMGSSSDDYRIQSFDMDTQMLLKTALKGRHVTPSQ